MHEGRSYRLKQTVQRIQDSVESQEQEMLRGIQGSFIVADCLTKRNTGTQRVLNSMIKMDTLRSTLHDSFEVNSKTCR